eukprot:5394130-Pyramimonas_sp.AAC.1
MRSPAKKIQQKLRWYRLRMILRSQAGQPSDSKKAMKNLCSTDGNAAARSKEKAKPVSPLKAAIAIASSTSTTLASMERPRKNPRWACVNVGAILCSSAIRTALAIRRLSQFVTFKGRTFCASYAG